MDTILTYISDFVSENSLLVKYVWTAAKYGLLLIVVLIFSLESFRFVWNATRKKVRGSFVKKGKTFSRLEQMLLALSKKDTPKAKTDVFFLIMIGIFIFVFLLCLSQNMSLISALAFSVVTAALPVGVLLSNFKNLQYKGSYEGEEMILEFINQYKLSQFNMVEAIDCCVYYLDKTPISKRALFHLSIKLKTASTEDAYRQALDDFVFMIGTEWSKMLANNIYLAISNHINVLKGLEDILKECKAIKRKIERTKQHSIEAMGMFVLLAPVLYIASLLASQFIFDMSILSFLTVQFLTPTGLKIGLVIIISGFISYILAQFINKPKFDI